MDPDPNPDPEDGHAPGRPPAAAAGQRSRPRIDVAPALHEAGHEVTDLGFEGIPDSGGVVHPETGPVPPDDPLDFVNVRMPSD